MNKENAFNIGLPKWPQCVINGTKITEEQALEIIRRSDSFFYGGRGNDESFNKAAERIFRVPYPFDLSMEWEDYIKEKEEFADKWGLIEETEYLHNSWISCCWVGGYHGWCHPDGTIAYCNNIGKWPSVEDVYNDLCIIGKHFPFLNLTLTLMNAEECEEGRESLVSMKLDNGEVSFIDTIPFKELEFNGIPLGFRMGQEKYFKLDDLQKWADKIYGNEEI